MLDLIRGLPFTINVDGSPLSINTDFRLWIAFGRIISKQIFDLSEEEVKIYTDILQFEKGKEFNLIDLYKYYDAMIQFYIVRELTPARSSDSSKDIILSFEADGSYLYSAFRQAYNIDLMRDKLHWHEFNALLRSLPNDTKLSEIMGFRCYKKNNDKIEAQYEKSKVTWTLPNVDGFLQATTQELEESIRLAEIKEAKQRELYG